MNIFGGWGGVEKRIFWKVEDFVDNFGSTRMVLGSFLCLSFFIRLMYRMGIFIWVTKIS